MITYKCPKCSFCFDQSDRAWDKAVMSGNCPKCNADLVNFAVPIQTPAPEKLKPSKQSSDLYLYTSGQVALVIGLLLAKFSSVMWLRIAGVSLMVFGFWCCYGGGAK